MYKVEKRFSFPMGHRLSKHQGRCFSLHGHNFSVLVGVKSEKLNENDMVIDFSTLKATVNSILDDFDHCLLLNNDDDLSTAQVVDMGMRVIYVDSDPTAEYLSKYLYEMLRDRFVDDHPHIQMDYVTVFENDNSKATYTE